ncbi:MAG: FecR domain-containing protein [Niabella sp.]|nr:FecR domain-containing protein [Niabella sp.]
MPESLQPHQVSALAEKWLNGTITAAELQVLENWYHEEYPSAIMWRAGEDEAQLREKMYQEIMKQTHTVRHRSGPGALLRKYWWAAASIILLLGITRLVQHNDHPAAAKTARAEQGSVNTGHPVSYTRSVLLPDGTVVLLRANSVLHYPAQFAKTLREVTLEGEAYFDVKHNNTPFIIHSGSVKTTVLGTAFNIRAYPGSGNIYVAVLRGKVKVENTRKEVTILTPNQQVTYHTAASVKPQLEQTDPAAPVTGWVQQDMTFEDVSFQTVADLLSRRYGTAIRFGNTALAACTIKAFFNGTESLDKVLESLCLISNARYTVQKDNSILLDGEGCK